MPVKLSNMKATGTFRFSFFVVCVAGKLTIWCWVKSASKTVCILEQTAKLWMDSFRPVEQVRHSEGLGLIQLSEVWFWKRALSKSFNTSDWSWCAHTQLKKTKQKHTQSTAQSGLKTKLFKRYKGVKDGRRQWAEGKGHVQNQRHNRDSRKRPKQQITEKTVQRENKIRPAMVSIYQRGNTVFCLSQCTACGATRSCWPWVSHLNARVTPSTLAP